MALINPAEEIEVWEVFKDKGLRTSTILSTHGVMMNCYELLGREKRYLTEEKVTQIEESFYQQFNRNVPDNIFIQIVFDSHANYDDVWKRSKAFPEPNNEIVKMLRSERLRYQKNKNLRRQSVWIVFGWSKGMTRSEFKNISKAQHVEKVKMLNELDKILVPIFEFNGFRLRPLDRNSVLELFYQPLNPFDGYNRPSFTIKKEPLTKEQRKNKKYKKLKVKGLREKLFSTKIARHNEYVRLGASEAEPGKRRYLKVLTLHDLPDESFFGMMEILNEIRIDFRVSFFMKVPNQVVYKRRLDTIRNVTDMLSRGEMIGRRNYEQEGKEQEVEDYAATLAALKMKIALGGMQVVIYGASREELSRNVSIFQNTVQQEQIKFVEEDRAHMREFMKTFPGMAISSERLKLLTANICLDLAPIFTAKQCDFEPVMVFENDRGELVLFDLTSPHRDKWNIAIMGATGSGKSVMTAMIIIYTILSSIRNGVLFVIDYAGPKSTYKTLAELLGGEFIPINADSDNALNPFPEKSEAMDKEGTLKGEIHSFLVTLTTILLFNKAEPVTTEDQHLRNIISNAIVMTYKNIGQDQCPIFSDVLQTIEVMFGDSEYNQRHVKEVHDLLKEFLKVPISKLFNRHTNVKPKSDFLVIDLFGIEAMEGNVSQALAYLATSWAKEFAFNPNERKFKYVILDEIAQLFRQKGMVNLVKELYSTARGHGASIFTVTQKYSDFNVSAVKGDITTNSEVQIFLPFLGSKDDAAFKGSEGEAELVAKDFGFNAKEYELLKTLRTGRGNYAEGGRYSEAMLRTIDENGESSCIKIRLYLSPMDYWTCTSSKTDLLKREHYLKKYPNRSKAEIIYGIADRWAKGGEI